MADPADGGRLSVCFRPRAAGDGAAERADAGGAAAGMREDGRAGRGVGAGAALPQPSAGSTVSRPAPRPPRPRVPAPPRPPRPPGPNCQPPPVPGASALLAPRAPGPAASISRARPRPPPPPPSAPRPPPSVPGVPRPPAPRPPPSAPGAAPRSPPPAFRARCPLPPWPAPGAPPYPASPRSPSPAPRSLAEAQVGAVPARAAGRSSRRGGRTPARRTRERAVPSRGPGSRACAARPPAPLALAQDPAGWGAPGDVGRARRARGPLPGAVARGVPVPTSARPRAPVCAPSVPQRSAVCACLCPRGRARTVLRACVRVCARVLVPSSDRRLPRWAPRSAAAPGAGEEVLLRNRRPRVALGLGD